jgi:hypothetical protein
MFRSELIAAYTKYKVSQMDHDALVNAVEIMLRDAYNHLSDDALIDELSEYAPHLIKLEMKV